MTHQRLHDRFASAAPGLSIHLKSCLIAQVNRYSWRLVWRKIWFPLFLVLLCFFKFWLIQAEEIYGREAQHDEIWFLNSASHWYWWSPYNWSAFGRPPAYPLFVAVVHLLAIPLRLAIEAFQMVGYFTLTAALRKAGLPRISALSIFAACVLHPVSFQANNASTADTFYTAGLAFVLGGFFFIWFGQRKILHAFWTGAALAVLWITRDESILLPPLIGIFLLLTVCMIPRDERSFKALLIRLGPIAGTLLGTLVILLLAVFTANYCTFHGFAACETVSPGFKAANRALLRIKPSRTIRFVSVTNEAVHLAFDVSPTFATLRKEFDGQLGHDWQQETLSTYQIPNEIGAAWFRWAWRAIAAHAGFHQNPAQADRFYRQVAREINDACDRGQVPSRRVFSSFFDPATLQSLRYLPNSFGRMAARFGKRQHIKTERADWNLNHAQSESYDQMAERRAALVQFGNLQIIGWAFQFDDPIQFVFYRDEGGEIQGATSRFSARPDVVAQFQGHGQVPLEMQFVVSINLFRDAIPKGDLAFVMRSGVVYSAPLSAVLAGQPPAANGVSLHYSIDSHAILPNPRGPTITVENFIGKYYPSLVVVFSFGGLLALSVLIFHLKKLRWDGFNAVLILLEFIIISRLLLFSFVDATSWVTLHDRFLFPIMPLYSVLLILLIYQAMRVAGTHSEKRPESV